ncbi:MAG: hypothetical protein AAF798_10770 [Bacteroidota bacterium]
MKKNLYIFTSRSLKPDLYVNVIGYCFSKFKLESIEEIMFLRLASDETEKKEDLRELKKTRINFLLQVENLSNSRYLAWSKELKSFVDETEPQSIEIESSFLNIYNQIKKKCNEEEIRIKVIFLADLENELNKIISDSTSEHIFELTGVPKKEFVSISLTLLSIHSSIYLFDMKRTLSYDENDLIHKLTYPKDFEHLKLNLPNYSVIKNRDKVEKENLKKGWLKKLKYGETGQVLDELTEYLNNHSSESSWEKAMNYSSRFHMNQKLYNNGSLEIHDYNQEVNRINKLLLDLINTV